MDDELLDLSGRVLLPDGDKALAVSRAELADWAWEKGLTLREAEILALQHGVWPMPYLRNHKQFSINDQIRLLSSHVLVVGLGGLGGVILEILARSGVGRIRAMDPDVFEESNLNRQLLSSAEAMDAPKAEAAADRVQSINPAVEFTALQARLDEENAPDAFDGVQAVADGLGDMASRTMLWSLARQARIPVASAAVAGAAGFAATVLPDGPDPASVLNAGGRGAESSLGTQGPAVHMAAGVECSEILALLLGKATPLSGKILIFDLDQAAFDTVSL